MEKYKAEESVDSILKVFTSIWSVYIVFTIAEVGPLIATSEVQGFICILSSFEILNCKVLHFNSINDDKNTSHYINKSSQNNNT